MNLCVMDVQLVKEFVHMVLLHMKIKNSVCLTEQLQFVELQVLIRLYARVAVLVQSLVPPVRWISAASQANRSWRR